MGTALGLILVLSGCATAAPAPAPEVVAAPAATGPVLAESTPTRIRIPALEVESPVIDLGLKPDGTMEVPADGAVAGWFTGAPTPGELGPAVIAAHVDWKGARGIFYDLRAMRPGDEVQVQREDGSTALFQVRAVEQFAKNRFPTEAVYGDIRHAGLRLVTCGGQFDRGARSYVDNIVVFAELVGST